MDIELKNAREPATEDDGFRVLIDRLWPRGVSREAAALDDWQKDISPSTGLRKWFNHDPDRFEEFRRRYIDELRSRRSQLTELRRRARDGRLTLVYGAGNHEYNDAVVMLEVLKQGLPRDDS